MASRPGPEAAKQPLTHHTTTCLTVVLCSFHEILCWFYARCNGTAKSSNFVSSVPEYVPKCLGDSQDILWQMWGEPLCTFLYFSPMEAVFPQSLSYCWIMNTDLNWGKWGLRFFRCCLGSFMNSWMSCHCTLGVILVGQPLLGRFSTVPSFLHLYIMDLTVVRWSPKASEMAVYPFPDWWMLTILGSNLFLNFF